LFTGSVGAVANNLWFYKSGFEKYNVGQTTGLAELELEVAAKGLISYFNSGEEYIDLTLMKDGEPFELFNGREVTHLKDVKGLIRLDYGVALGTLVYVLAYALISLFWRKRTYWRRLAGGVVWGGGITLGIIVALGIMSMLVDFQQVFTQFHFLAFTNELWMLDPTRDYLIMLFPQGFFQDATLLTGGITAGLAVALGVVSGVYLRRTKK
jgi:integral membrane protein (TIGR01906 family)